MISHSAFFFSMFIIIYNRLISREIAEQDSAPTQLIRRRSGILFRDADCKTPAELPVVT